MDTESWITEKLQLVSSQDYGKDEDASAKLLTKHKAFELDLHAYDGVVKKLGKEADKLVKLDRVEGAEVAAKQVNVWTSLLALRPSLILKTFYGIFYSISCCNVQWKFTNVDTFRPTKKCPH